MDTGMMWFDNDPKKPLDLKVLQAADYFRHKYGRTPDLCLVNPGTLAKNSPSDQPLQAGRVAIRGLRAVLPGHLWIGVDDGPAENGLIAKSAAFPAVCAAV